MEVRFFVKKNKTINVSCHHQSTMVAEHKQGVVQPLKMTVGIFLRSGTGHQLELYNNRPSNEVSWRATN